LLDMLHETSEAIGRAQSYLLLSSYEQMEESTILQRLHQTIDGLRDLRTRLDQQVHQLVMHYSPYSMIPAGPTDPSLFAAAPVTYPTWDASCPHPQLQQQQQQEPRALIHDQIGPSAIWAQDSPRSSMPATTYQTTPFPPALSNWSRTSNLPTGPIGPLLPPS
jgi:hypothetical protein